MDSANLSLALILLLLVDDGPGGGDLLEEGVLWNSVRMDAVSNVTGWKRGRSRPRLVPLASCPDGQSVPKPVSGGVKLGPIRTFVLNCGSISVLIGGIAQPCD